MFDKDVNQARVPLNVTNSIEPAPFYQRAAVNSRTGGIPLSQNANIRELMKEKYYAKLTFNYGIVLVFAFLLRALSLLIEISEYSSCPGFSSQRVVPFFNYILSALFAGISAMLIKRGQYKNCILYIFWIMVFLKLYSAYLLAGVTDLYGQCYLVSSADDSNWIFSVIELIFWILYACRLAHVHNELNFSN